MSSVLLIPGRMTVLRSIPLVAMSAGWSIKPPHAGVFIQGRAILKTQSCQGQLLVRQGYGIPSQMVAGHGQDAEHDNVNLFK